MTQNVLASVRPGSIVLFHANGRGWSTEAALPGIVAALKAKGYEFVTVTELLAAGEPVMSETCYDSRPGDTDQPRFRARWRPAVGSIRCLAGASDRQRSSCAPRPWPSRG